MSSNLRIFFLSFLVSIPVWWGINEAIENLTHRISQSFLFEHRELLSAQLLQGELATQSKPIRNSNSPSLSIGAKSALSVFVQNDGKTKVLFEKEPLLPLPIASLTKLMTALVVVRNYPLDQKMIVSENAVVLGEENGGYGRVGDVFTAKDLLYPLLIESSNDAARALSEVIGMDGFVNLMNLEAQRTVGLFQTHFVNPTGLDPQKSEDSMNSSSAQDLVTLSSYLIQDYPQIFDILALPEFDLKTADGKFHRTLINTNPFLAQNDLPLKVIGGKTGWTPKARGCMILVLQAPRQQGYIVNVILGSEDRFGEMEKLVDWIYQTYQW